MKAITSVFILVFHFTSCCSCFFIVLIFFQVMDIDFIKNLKINSENLKYLNKHFQSNSYSIGFSPSPIDTALLAKVKSSSSSFCAYPHLKRWFNHVLSFPEEKCFPQFSKVGSLSILC